MNLGVEIRGIYLLTFSLCLLVLLVLGVVLWPQPQRSRLAIQFVSHTHTNEPGRRPCVVFGVTNLSHKSLTWTWAYPQVRSNGVWSEVEIIGPGTMHEDLDGGQGMRVIVAVPDRGEAWRLPIVWSYVPRSHLGSIVADVVNSRREAKNGSVPGWTSGFGWTCCTNFSSEMASTQAEPTGAANGSQPFSSETNRTSSAAGSRR
jgi:hypothetical protein